MTAVMQDGATVEIATVGDEGLLGINAFLGGEMVGGETMLQVPDTPETTAEVLSAEPVPISSWIAAVTFFECVQRYSQGLSTLMMHSTACIAFHSVRQRCCRWLLMTHDRVRRDRFHLSHEFLAMMLGSTRPTVTVVATSAPEGRPHQLHAWPHHNPWTYSASNRRRVSATRP